MQIHELTKNITEAGLGKSAYDFLKRQARNYMASKTRLPADVFKNQAERDEDEAEQERREAEAEARAKLKKMRKDAEQGAEQTKDAEDEQGAEKTAKTSNTANNSASPGTAAMGQMANQLAGNKPNTMANAPVSTRNTAKPGNPNLQAQPAAPVNYNIPAYQRKGLAAPVTTPAPTKAPVNYNIPAYLRKGQAAPAATAPAAVPQQPTIKTASGQVVPTAPSMKPYQVPGAATSPAAAVTRTPAPAPSAMAGMAKQLTAKPTQTKAGGTVTRTPTGVVHKAKPVAPVATAKTYTGPKTKISAPPVAGAPTSAEYANLEKRLQQAMAAQGQTTK